MARPIGIKIKKFRRLGFFKPSSLFSAQNNLKFYCFYVIINLPINKNMQANI